MKGNTAIITDFDDTLYGSKGLGLINRDLLTYLTQQAAKGVPVAIVSVGNNIDNSRNFLEEIGKCKDADALIIFLISKAGLIDSKNRISGAIRSPIQSVLQFLGQNGVINHYPNKSEDQDAFIKAILPPAKGILMGKARYEKVLGDKEALKAVIDPVKLEEFKAAAQEMVRFIDKTPFFVNVAKDPELLGNTSPSGNAYTDFDNSKQSNPHLRGDERTLSGLIEGKSQISFFGNDDNDQLAAKQMVAIGKEVTLYDASIKNYEHFDMSPELPQPLPQEEWKKSVIENVPSFAVTAPVPRLVKQPSSQIMPGELVPSLLNSSQAEGANKAAKQTLLQWAASGVKSLLCGCFSAGETGHRSV